MLYYLAKFIMTPALWLYFRKSSFLWAEKIPAKGPVVIISNHAASFLDAMIMGVKLRRPMYYYVRSDVFKGRLTRFILNQLHMIPIYSKEKDKSELHRNADSFNVGEEVLKNDGLLLIFPEGTSRVERNLLPLKKGVSRIVMQALQKSPGKPLYIVPLGIHYSRHAFRSDLQLVSGDPVPVNTFSELYQSNPAKAINQLTEELEEHFEKVVLYVDQPERTTVLENNLQMADNDQGKQFTEADFCRQKRICRQLSSLNEEEYKIIEHKQLSYLATLSAYGVNDKSFSEKSLRTLPPLLLVICFPLFALGIILNIWPYLVGRKTADKKVTRVDFYTSVLVAVAAVVYFAWILLWLTIAIIFSSVWITVICILSPFLAWFALWWTDRYRDWINQQQFEKLHRDEPDKIIKLKELRKEFLNG